MDSDLPSFLFVRLILVLLCLRCRHLLLLALVKPKIKPTMVRAPSREDAGQDRERRSRKILRRSLAAPSSCTTTEGAASLKSTATKKRKERTSQKAPEGAAPREAAVRSCGTPSMSGRLRCGPTTSLRPSSSKLRQQQHLHPQLLRPLLAQWLPLRTAAAKRLARRKGELESGGK